MKNITLIFTNEKDNSGFTGVKKITGSYEFDFNVNFSISHGQLCYILIIQRSLEKHVFFFDFIIFFSYLFFVVAISSVVTIFELFIVSSEVLIL